MTETPEDDVRHESASFEPAPGDAQTGPSTDYPPEADPDAADGADDLPARAHVVAEEQVTPGSADPPE